MIDEWIAAKPDEIVMVLISSVVTYVAILSYTRLTGLRSFSKMSAADFAMTVAVGSLFASTVSSAKPTLVVGLCALASLFAGQWLVALLRRKSNHFSQMVDNEPLLLMYGDTIIDEHLDRSNVTRSDLFGKLREANALAFDEVLAVVFETTGDISVLHSSDPEATLDPALVQNVIGADQIKRRLETSTLKA